MHRTKDVWKLVKRGRRTYGAIYLMPHTGAKVYFAWRKQAEIFRAGKPTTSEALREGTACWALDDETLIDLKAQGVELVGVWCKDTDDRYMTKLSLFMDRTKAKVLDYNARGGSLQRYLPLQYFAKRTGETKIR